MHKKVGFIVLNYNNISSSLSCIDSILNLGILESDVVFVDNSNSELNCNIINSNYRGISTLISGSNLGYAGGNNIGIKYLFERGYDFFIIINNDSKLIDISFLDDLNALPSNVAFIGLNISDKNISQRSSKFFEILYKEKFSFDPYYDNTFVKDYLISGAGFIISRKIIDKIGYFDENYFLYFEELDFIYRAYCSGYVSLGYIINKPHLVHERELNSMRPYVWYYLSRNIFYFVRTNKLPLKYLLLSILTVVKYLYKNIFNYKINKTYNNVYLILRGILDGFFLNKTGNGKNI